MSQAYITHGRNGHRILVGNFMEDQEGENRKTLKYILGK
jgi:hypothetical protein